MSAIATRTSVRTADGVRLALDLRPATPRSGTTPAAVVVVHGFAADATEPRVAAVARRLADRGHTVVTYDARGHGASSGESALGVLEHHDVDAAVRVAREHAARVVVVGASMGAIATLRHAARHGDDVAGSVVVACPAEWRLPRNTRGVAAALVVRTAWGRAFARRRLGIRIAASCDRGAAPIDTARDVRVPVAVLHGRDDPMIDPASAAAIHANLAGPARLALVPGLGHGFDPAAQAAPAVCDAVDWILTR